MSLKTLHLTNAWHASSGGIATFYRALLEAANRTGQPMRIVAPGGEDSIQEAGPFGRIYHVRAPRAPMNRSYRMLCPNRFLFPGAAIQRILNAERPDLIEVSDKYSIPYLAGLLRVGMLMGVNFRPAVVGLTCERMDENIAAYVSPSPSAALFARHYMKWIYFPMFDHHIAVSEHVADELRAASRGHKVERGVWIRPMGVDCRRFTPALRSRERRRELAALAGADENATIAVYAGRLVPEKNLGLLVATMGRLSPDFRLLVAGDGILQESLRQTCERELPWRVHFLGHVSVREELASLFANADVFIHPNPREPFGITPLEAMASGLPLVAPNVGGITSYADNLNAWLAAPDADAFAMAVRCVVDNPEERNRRVARALETARQRGWENVAADYLRLYRELHARTQGQSLPNGIPPSFRSTLGDRWGRLQPAQSFSSSETKTHKMFLPK